MRSSQVYQSFQPIGGVSASVSPTAITKGRNTLPCDEDAESLTSYRPGFAGLVPEMIPVTLSRLRAAGSPVASKRIGRVPVQGIRYRNGRPGRQPKTRGPFM